MTSSLLIYGCSDSRRDGVNFTDAENGDDWPGYGRLYDEQHYSPLDQVNVSNVSRLGLAWSADLPVVNNPATAPIEINGVIYISYGYSVVHAFDAVSGKQLWAYDPDVPAVAGDTLKLGWGIRGVAYWDGLVITGTQDGRLIALDAQTGKVRWSVATFEKGELRSITGPPRVFAGRVIIGHGGGDYGPIRGYVTAYDARTGRQLWRFHTVPGNPANGFENKAMAMAAKTWTGEWWKHGGGGTVWNAITYDPEFDRIYIGTGNGQPWNQKIRSPKGGDNLFLCSVVALDAKTGNYVWHYQTNPGESWDYNSAMDMTLVDLTIGGQKRSVMLHAPKNGFLYVIDRQNGKLISADKIVPHVTWASGVDVKSGRPIENPEARYPGGQFDLWPYPGGAHNWPAQSYSPKTKLLYIPTVDLGARYDDRRINARKWKPGGVIMNTGVDLTAILTEGSQGARLIAWDPVARREVWHRPLPGYASSGTMASGGGLVFQGRLDGKFIAYDAQTGKAVWSFFAGTGVIAQPISFARKGVQYISVIAGYGGAYGARAPGVDRFGWTMFGQQRRLLTFRLDGTAKLPPSRREAAVPLKGPVPATTPALAMRGAISFSANCAACHGEMVRAGGAAPDLRASGIVADKDSFFRIVRDGALVSSGMPKFRDLDPAELEAIRHYIRAEAQK
ncbi:PQQ-dependent dehydrogenase, methanol/ethanol family [Rhizorhabdus argentea]|uniref:PQQ-dependent dehydrogenase, methanol/ethanol family n=1 Tax=Rhizorhabdus argentea TaxID=1387174 RepID=UPI0030EBC097